MKKNLFNKNIKYISLKQKFFEDYFLKKAVSFNFLINTTDRNKLGFSAYYLSAFYKIPRSSNFRSQCYLTWRTGSFYSFFRLTRLTLRENFSFGLVKGLRKSTW